MKQITNPHVLVNLVSRRVRQLNAGHRALTATNGVVSPTDIALKEIAEGKIIAEYVEMEGFKKKK